MKSKAKNVPIDVANQLDEFCKERPHLIKLYVVGKAISEYLEKEKAKEILVKESKEVL